jgi:hypothetical protein
LIDRDGSVSYFNMSTIVVTVTQRQSEASLKASTLTQPWMQLMQAKTAAKDAKKRSRSVEPRPAPRSTRRPPKAPDKHWPREAIKYKSKKL